MWDQHNSRMHAVWFALIGGLGTLLNAVPSLAAQPQPQPVTVIEVGSAGTDGSGSLPISASGVQAILFGGVTPPHGFQVQIQDGSAQCPVFISDTSNAFHGLVLTTSYPGSNFPTLYPTPPGYQPIGPVTLTAGTGCGIGSQINFAARMW